MPRPRNGTLFINFNIRLVAMVTVQWTLVYLVAILENGGVTIQSTELDMKESLKALDMGLCPGKLEEFHR